MKRTVLSWVVYLAVITTGLRIYYGPVWPEMNHISPQDAWRLRLTAVAVVLAVSYLASAISGLLPEKVRVARGLLAGLLTGLTLWKLAEWIGDYYLGGFAHYDPHRWGMLMVESYGMGMVMLVAPAIGIMAWIRAEVASYVRPNARKA